MSVNRNLNVAMEGHLTTSDGRLFHARVTAVKLKARKYRMLKKITWYFQGFHNHAEVSACEHMLHQEWKKYQSTHMFWSLVSLHHYADSVAVCYNQ